MCCQSCCRRENPKLEARNPKQIENPRRCAGAAGQSQIQDKPPMRPRVQFGPPSASPASSEQVLPGAKRAKPAKKQKLKNDPKHVAAARELRDRWLERVNADPSALLSPGKYDVARQIAAGEAGKVLANPVKQLPNAA
jgi:hypothetical protein